LTFQSLGQNTKLRGAPSDELVEFRRGYSTTLTKLSEKYDKNPEIFQKSDLLFGYHLAKAKIKEVKTVILTEGQFDTIRAHQYGIENCVSMCGLSLSEKQVKTLKEHVKNYYIVYGFIILVIYIICIILLHIIHI
jgi:hypothetical protein